MFLIFDFFGHALHKHSVYIYSLRSLTLPQDGIKWRSSSLNTEFLKDASTAKSLTAAIKNTSIGLDLSSLKSGREQEMDKMA